VHSFAVELIAWLTAISKLCRPLFGLQISAWKKRDLHAHHRSLLRTLYSLQIGVRKYESVIEHELTILQVQPSDQVPRGSSHMGTHLFYKTCVLANQKRPDKYCQRCRVPLVGTACLFCMHVGANMESNLHKALLGWLAEEVHAIWSASQPMNFS